MSSCRPLQDRTLSSREDEQGSRVCMDSGPQPPASPDISSQDPVTKGPRSLLQNCLTGLGETLVNQRHMIPRTITISGTEARNTPPPTPNIQASPQPDTCCQLPAPGHNSNAEREKGLRSEVAHGCKLCEQEALENSAVWTTRSPPCWSFGM